MNPNTWPDGTPRSTCNAFAAVAQYLQHKADFKAGHTGAYSKA